MHSESIWSELGYKPIMLYSKKVDAYIVYWRGIGMTRRQALSIASGIFLGIWASPQVKQRMWEEFRQIYYAGGFNTTEWDPYVTRFDRDPSSAGEQHYGFLLNRVILKLNKNSDGTFLSPEYMRKAGLCGLEPETPYEVLSWFRNDQATITD